MFLDCKLPGLGQVQRLSQGSVLGSPFRISVQFSCGLENGEQGYILPWVLQSRRLEMSSMQAKQNTAASPGALDSKLAESGSSL